MLKDWKAGLVAIAIGFALPTVGAFGADDTKVVSATDQEDMVRTTLIGLQSAIGAKNVADATAQFSEDVTFIDEAGAETRGSKALGERFEQLFKSSTAHSVGIHPESISFPSASVAIIVGEVSRKRDQEEMPASRFSMLMVRATKGWLINELTETAMQAAEAESELKDLNWLVGHWSADKPDTSAQLDFEWAPSKKFITSKCIVKTHDAPPQVDSQVIGWDPQHNEIISWHFDSNGGFGSGTWIKQPNENKWTVDVLGVGADGSNTAASNVFTEKSPDEFIWQSVHRSLDGTAVADTEPITVRRVKP